MPKIEEIIGEIRKGRRFRRPGYPWGYIGDSQGVMRCSSLAVDDWELESVKKEITREDLAKAWDSLKFGVLSSDRSTLFDDLCKDLGL